ncbi:MAG: ABC transporter permease [Lachnospiraceae bacterium]|nr:ABC transporter permease [Lachnospiraceae bacterium]
MPLAIFQTALDNGLIYALIALSLFISFTILNICDLSTDGCYMLGAAVGVAVTIAGHPVLAIFAAMAAGIISGFTTALLQTRFGVQSILAGIIVNTALYTINLFVMGMKTNLNVVGKKTIYDLVAGLGGSPFWKAWHRSIFLFLLLIVIALLINWFLKTRLGLSIRATGDSSAMVSASSINPAFTVTVGLCIGGALTGMAGSLIGQYNKNCEINMGTGMVTIALASLIIGQTLFGRGKMVTRIFGTIAGSVIYRFIIALALRINVPTQAFKLVSAVIVAIAIATPAARKMIAERKDKHDRLKKRKEMLLTEERGM